jgi:Flp pilus assembly protein TadD
MLAAACHHTPKPVSVAPLPQAAYSHYLAGKLALYRDDVDTATRELSAAAAAAPDQPMIAVELARALVKAKREDAARDVMLRARAAWPDHAQVWLASGEVLEATQAKEALHAYRRAIELEPTDERGYIGLARTQQAGGDHAGAERTLRSLIAKIPESVDGHYRLAQRLAEKGDRDAAVVQLRAVLEWEPDHLDARMDLSRTLRRMGKLPEAVVQARSAFDRAGQPMDLAEELFWLLCEADDRQGAIDLLTLLDDDRSDADALATVAALERGLGRTPEARVVAEHIKTLDPDEVGALNLLGYTLAQRKQRLDDAERYLARARDLQPGDPSILDSWGYLLLQRGRTRQAVRALDRAARFSPREPEILVHLAQAWAADGAPGRASEVLDAAVALKPPPELVQRIDSIRAGLGIR